MFDDIFARLTPDRLLRDPRATGEGVAVAVIDSGVERAVLEDKFRAAGTPIHPIDGALFRADTPAPLPYTGHQSSPHGTTVADVILTVAPRVKLYSADVFGPAGTCEVETVIAALRHAIDVWKVKVINLSLGVPEHKLQQLPRRQALLRAIEEAYFRDVLVFAAAHNEHPLTRSYPAVFTTPLVSVDKGVFDDPLGFAYRLRDHVEFQAHGKGYLGPFAREPATSWATPHLSAIAARILSLKPDLKPFEMKTLLYWLTRGGSNGSGR
ncbi:MAG: S8 family serine peptidase [Gemmataceae bacterium]